MKMLLAALTAVALAALAPAQDAAKGKKVQFDVHTGHFQKNNAGLEGASSYLVFTDRAAFDKVFGVGAIMGRQNFVPRNAFDKKMVVAVIKRGNAVTQYKVGQATAAAGTLSVEYTAKAGAAGTATFASPLVLSVAKNDYESVVFIENGKKVATIKVGK